MENSYQRKYGFNVYNQPPEDFIDYAFKNNLGHLEINLTKSHSAPESFGPERIEKLNQLSDEHNIKLSLHLPFNVNISDIISVVRKENASYLKRSIGLANKIKATHITVHIGNFYWFPVEKLMRKKALERFVKNLKEIIELSEKENVVIALENVVPIPHGSDFYLLGDNITDFEYIFESVQSDKLKFCLDTGHANMGEGVLEYLNILNDRLVAIHYHDNSGSNDDHMPVGLGSVPWKSLAEELIKLDFSGPLISECRNIKPHEAALSFESHFENILK